MNSPYKYQLDRLKEQEVVVHRANASDVKGEVSEVDEDGCVINQPASPERVLRIFIAYEDIRGVGHEGHDYRNI